MREIKFRGKVADEPNEWVYGYLTNENTIYQPRETKYSKNCGVGVFTVIPESIGQFTGLYDKDGVEIYEGDVIRLDDEYRKLISSATAESEEDLCRKDCIIGFKDGAFMYGRNKYKPEDLDTYLWLSEKNCTVIGNIYIDQDGVIQYNQFKCYNELSSIVYDLVEEVDENKC